VEEFAIKRSGKKACYPPTEKIQIIEVPDFPSLGKLAAIRFIEWLQLNPEGVICLPTGKTPEHFITWITYFLHHWHQKNVGKELETWGLTMRAKPQMGSFTFVQIDEFYPMDQAYKNSFAYYIARFYVKQFGLDPQKAFLMNAWTTGAPRDRNLGLVFPDGRVDLSFRFRCPASDLEQLQCQPITAADEYAMEYENRIQQLGGIGFFLGGIGPDGHIGFNIRGTDHFNTTSLTSINYETAAAAATDLGGIEVASQKAVLTIGLKTIAQNPTATALIIAAGDSKAKVVANAVQNKPSVLYPATALQSLSGARFYLTKGAASLLIERRCHKLASLRQLPDSDIERILIDVAFQKKKHLTQLTNRDLKADRLGKIVLKNNNNLPRLIDKIAASLKKKISRGLDSVGGVTILHTAPHHDDIMLGYLPYILHLVRNDTNFNYFATLTSGFTSVSNVYTLKHLHNVENFLQSNSVDKLIKQDYFSPRNLTGRNRDIYQYLDGIATDSPEMQKEGEARRMLRNLVELAHTTDTKLLKKQARKIRNYLEQAYPGKKDIPMVQLFKGMIREWEEELLWGHLGFNSDHIYHLRLGFYTGDIFTSEPEWDRDVKPILRLLKKLQPDIVTVAFDPEGSGPDTHYKVLQATAEALKGYLKKPPKKDLQIWGYRNVWHRFHPAEANIFVPVSMNSLAIMKSAFHTCFGSQRSASFPSYEYEGPFCNLAQKILAEQFSVMKTCLGRDFFYASELPRLRATRGLNFLRVMTPEEFVEQARSLKSLMESKAANKQ